MARIKFRTISSSSNTNKHLYTTIQGGFLLPPVRMRFPIGYTDVFLPELLVYLLTAIKLIRKSVCAVFSLLREFLEADTTSYLRSGSEAVVAETHSKTAPLIREFLPVVKFTELTEDLESPESCAVCLYDLCGDDEIRRLANCCHIFHRSCMDRCIGRI